MQMETYILTTARFSIKRFTEKYGTIRTSHKEIIRINTVNRRECYAIMTKECIVISRNCDII